MYDWNKFIAEIKNNGVMGKLPPFDVETGYLYAKNIFKDDIENFVRYDTGGSVSVSNENTILPALIVCLIGDKLKLIENANLQNASFQALATHLSFGPYSRHGAERRKKYYATLAELNAIYLCLKANSELKVNIEPVLPDYKKPDFSIHAVDSAPVYVEVTQPEISAKNLELMDILYSKLQVHSSLGNILPLPADYEGPLIQVGNLSTPADDNRILQKLITESEQLKSAENALIMVNDEKIIGTKDKNDIMGWLEKRPHICGIYFFKEFPFTFSFQTKFIANKNAKIPDWIMDANVREI